MMRKGIPLSGTERNVSFLNLGKPQGGRVSRFATVSAVSGVDFTDDARGLAIVDWDFDGDLDLWVSNRTGPQARFLRNELRRSAHFVAFKLEGVRCNRDAIGARVKVTLPDGQTIVQALRAGEGFLSQSSKWIHVGLGGADRVAKVDVHWPDGEIQTLPELAVDQMYELRQGDASPRMRAPPATNQASLAPSTCTEPELTSTAAIYLSDRLPLLRLPYEAIDRIEPTVKNRSARPLLLLLWTSVCPDCKEELEMLTKEKARLDELGLDVLALSIDGLGEAPGSPHKARKMLLDMGFPFPSGQAFPETLDKLLMLHRHVFYRPYTLPVPVSFLVDGTGQIATVYRGQVSIDQLESHVARMREETDNGSRTATISSEHKSPFPGLWLKSPVFVELSAILAEVLAKGWAVDAADLLDRYRDRMDESQLTGMLHAVGAAILETQGPMDRAEQYLKEVIRRDPNHSRAFNNLGAVLQAKGDLEAAVLNYRRAIELDPKYPAPRSNLGVILLKARRVNEAIEHLEVACQYHPKDVGSLYTLGAAYAEARRLNDAMTTFEKVISLSPDHGGAKIAQVKVLILMGDPDAADDLAAKAIAQQGLRPNEVEALVKLRQLIRESRKNQSTPK